MSNYLVEVATLVSEMPRTISVMLQLLNCAKKAFSLCLPCYFCIGRRFTGVTQECGVQIMSEPTARVFADFLRASGQFFF